VDYQVHRKNEVDIVEVTSPIKPIRSAQDFLDLAGNVPSRRIILKKEMIDEAFFDLKTGTAGEILQKVSNYNMKLAIVGDFAFYESRSLRDFIYESNKTNQVVFVSNTEKALDRLSM
jgi:hypothetical protein